MYACHFSRLSWWLDLCCCIFYAGDAHYLQVDIRKYGSNSYNRKYLKEQKTEWVFAFYDNLSVQALIVKPFKRTLCYIRFRNHTIMPIYWHAKKYNCSLLSNYGTHLFWIKPTGKLISPGSFLDSNSPAENFPLPIRLWVLNKVQQKNIVLFLSKSDNPSQQHSKRNFS